MVEFAKDAEDLPNFRRYHFGHLKHRISIIGEQSPGCLFLRADVDQCWSYSRQASTNSRLIYSLLSSANCQQRFVVSESSGCLDLSESTEKYSLSRNHFNMNKFGKPTEEDFLTVCDVVKRMVRMAPGLALARSQRKYNP